MKNILTLNDLSRLLAERCGDATDSTTAENFIRQFFNNIAAALQTEEHVDIDGFGTFSRDSRTNKVTFIPVQEVADKINEPFSFFEAVELDDKYVDEEPQPEQENVAEKTEEQKTAEPAPADTPEEKAAVPVEDSPIEVSYETLEENPADELTVKGKETPTYEYTQEMEQSGNQNIEHQKAVNEEHESWHMPWWIPGLVGLFIGFAIGYSINLVTLPESDDYEDDAEEATELVEQIVPAGQEDAVAEVVAEAENVTPATPAPEVKEQVQPAPVAEPTKDTVRSGYYLTSMARKYFGDTSFWCYIYEENKQKLGDPNKIPAGTEVVIPAAEKYGIDKNNPESIKKAKAKVAEINARYK